MTSTQKLASKTSITSRSAPAPVALAALVALSASIVVCAPGAARAETGDLPPPTASSASSASSGAGVSIRVEGGVGSSASSTSTAGAPPAPTATRDDRDSRDSRDSREMRDGRNVDGPSAAAAEKSSSDLNNERLLQGFRLGYSYIANSTVPVKTFDGQSIADRVGMRTPSSFLIGYEAFYRMASHSWLNVILVGNVLIGGLEQSKFFPTANALLGFEFNNSFQVGVGVNLAPLKETYAHTVFAAGWTPRVGSFYVPIHFFFVPDVDGNHRMGVTTGVTW